MSPSPEQFAAIVPIRSWATGKSRLDLGGKARETLGQAFALDVVSVLQQSLRIDAILVVSADDEVRDTFADYDLVADRDRGLDDAVAQGIARAVARGCSRVIVVPSDLPCLTVSAVNEVLDLAAGSAHAYCPDAEGDGTSLVISHHPQSLVTLYGRGSAAAHAAAGLVPLLGAPAGARRDVDTLEHLREADSLGVGPRTASALVDMQSLREV